MDKVGENELKTAARAKEDILPLRNRLFAKF